ncbi:hypothetical protein DFAR_680008 [Desulfarculales bacterium]
MAKRFEYVIRLGVLALVTGDVGSGEAIVLRWAASRLHQSEYQVILVTTAQSSILELYRQFCVELEGDTASFSRTVLTNGLQGRGQKSSGRRLPPGHEGLPLAPPQNRRRKKEGSVQDN